ncbi:hypothetical protein BO70DRAFT_305249 [Aspergillus heteromorphus CBS 117.55]|uniref:Ribosomal protein S15 n=1 Tax=Aspergillus heteromorphus CBS 117.55 TaxID=1448321 RepID=A0A317X3K8_9EURO|nr:uncharacterized protein BO70DRAFT_305249 [Aspergillus heteromorphus CBS 117.55]PWY92087.1 hypothetical protein BO70DRAFT_305249 [Aspergillus heteromorphus CBS 117.55]
MPPRFPTQSSLRAFTGSSSIQSPFAALSLNPTQTSVRAGSSRSREIRRHDPFLLAQSRQRKAANISRQQVLTKERAESLGDPVQSRPTPFIEEIKKTQSLPQDPKLNYFITPEGLRAAMEYSKDLTTPLQNADRDTADPQLEKEAAERHIKEHENAEEAIRRIAGIGNGNAKDHMRLHTQSCIETFGRHNTDRVLGLAKEDVSNELGETRVHAEQVEQQIARAGPDTGSPEVQIAILTLKILRLTEHLLTARQDKHNKRNLRVLVHRRQKMLRYLRRKDRGGERWKNVMESLGLSDAAWKGEISF